MCRIKMAHNVPQLADGGDLKPKMFGLTTKINKMQKSSINNETPAIGNVLLAAAFPFSLEMIKKRFPVFVDIQETECNSMMNNHDRLLFKKEYYNEYCLVEIHKGTQQLGFTIFKSDWKDFDKIESDFMEGFSFAPKDKSEVFVIMNTLV